MSQPAALRVLPGGRGPTRFAARLAEELGARQQELEQAQAEADVRAAQSARALALAEVEQAKAELEFAWRMADANPDMAGQWRPLITSAAEHIAAGYTVLDVREPDEYEEGALPGAIHIPRGHLEAQIENRIADKSATIVVYSMAPFSSSAAFTWATVEFF